MLNVLKYSQLLEGVWYYIYFKKLTGLIGFFLSLSGNGLLPADDPHSYSYHQCEYVLQWELECGCSV